MNHFSDSALIVRTRPHGEGAMIVNALCAQHGMRAAYVHAGRVSKTLRGVLQPGNFVHLEWQGNHAHDLGRFSIEGDRPISPFALTDAPRLMAIQSVCALIDQCVGERESYPDLFAGTQAWFDGIDGEIWAPTLIMWELQLLQTLGFGLKLDQCVVTGAHEGLSYVSPKSGGAVSEGAAQPYAHKLLPLPGFLIGSGSWDDTDIANGLSLSGYFLFHRVLDPLSRTIPDVRDRLYRHFAPLPAGE